MNRVRALFEPFIPHVKRRRVYLQALSVVLVALRRLLRVIRFRKIEMDLAFGSGDPALTGLATGAVAAVSGLARSKCRAVRFSIRPVFGAKRLAVDGQIEITFAPSDLLRALAGIGFASLRKRELRRFAFGFLWRKFFTLFKD